MAVDLEFHRSFSLDLLILGRKLEFDAFGDVILDHEGGFAHGRCLGVGERPHPPGPVGTAELSGTAMLRPPAP